MHNIRLQYSCLRFYCEKPVNQVCKLVSYRVNLYRRTSNYFALILVITYVKRVSDFY